MASFDSSMAPRSDSSACRLCGGPRPPPPPPCWRRRASSMDWTTAAYPAGTALWGTRGSLLGIAGGRRPQLSTTPNICSEGTAPFGQLSGDDLDRDAELDVGVELHRDLVGAQALDGLVEV